ncbi:MAG TPA: Hsp20/alpha crystallin family protein [Chitinophagaceae bacterium]|nr:Hsp20/alpha crystallin family protein [Chitinophagaceae bacterium]
MESSLTYNETCSAYPGQYVPLPDIETSKTDQMNIVTEPLINMDEFDDYFRIEVAIPGIRKEDILISLHDNVLSVTVCHRPAPGAVKKTRIHEFDVSYFERHILLPEDADAQLISAEYKVGILNLYIPKAIEPAKNHPVQIAVY